MQHVRDALGTAPKIAILRGGGLGDFLVTTPALRALRAVWPAAIVVLLTTPYLAPLARRYAAIDRVVLVPPYPGVVAGPYEAGAATGFLAAMQAECFDLALQWHGGGRHSNGCVRQLGARLTAGFRTPDAASLDYALPYDERQHEVLRYLDLLALLGVPARGTHLDLPVLTSDRDAVAALGDALDLEQWAAGRLVAVSLGAADPTRRWAPEQFAAVVDVLLAEFDLPGVVVEAPAAQSGDAERFVRALACPARAVNLAGRTSLGALIGLTSRYRLLLTNDSGPAHIASALGTPSVVVFGSANPLNWAPLNRTWHRVVADWAAPCRYLPDDGCASDSYPPCLQAVDRAAVLEAARGLLCQQEAMRDRRQPACARRLPTPSV